MGFMDTFTEKLSDIAVVFDNNKHLNVIKNTFMASMGFIIVGSFATLFNTILCSPATGLAKFPALAWLQGLSPMFSSINYVTMNLMAVFIATIMGFLYGKQNKVNQITNALLCVVTYLSVSPLTGSLKVDETVHTVKNVLPAVSTNSEALFTAIIVSILASELFFQLGKIDKIKIKMPAQVPKNIANTFNDLIPITIVIFAIAIIGHIILSFSGMYLTQIIYKVIQIPLQQVINTPFGVVAMTFTSLLFWCIGIHGNQLIAPLRSPLTAAALATNVALVEAGQLATEPFTGALWVVFITMTGSGITMSLILSILAFSKREDYRAIAKVSLVPGIFGVNEPIIFGLPIVLNPIMCVPFVLSGCAAAAISFFACSSGLLVCNSVATPWGLPLFINALVAYGTWRAILVQLIILTVCFVIYTPFVKAANKELEKQCGGA
ncbi:PTS sugar transporter subunit IIC [Hungatella effluvii]|uniref:PTS sugar transporter subunit IIC n=1 Tax=Hungatella effluvii TaxID=1096246 RepID=UPI0022E79E77|nr:PTS transporter subunit EIIC [Hungatella effluvii]